MVRTQIQLPAEQHRRLQRWAQRRGISFSEAVRRCITDKLSREESSPAEEDLPRAALAVCGKYSDPSGETHVAERHDEHLDEAFRR